MAAGRSEFSGRSANHGYSRTMTRAPRQMLTGAVLCAVAFVALLVLAYDVGPARWLDAAAFDGFATIRRHPAVATRATDSVHEFDPALCAVMACALILIAVFSRGLRVSAAATVLLVG